MRIISNFKDYYDGPATMFGQEPIFYRTALMPYSESYDEHKFAPMTHEITSNEKKNRRDFVYNYSAYIIFCGKAYHMHYQSVADSFGFMQNRTYTHHEVSDSDGFNRLIGLFKEMSADDPIMSIWWSWDYKPRYMLNPCLKLYQFYKVMDAYTAAQEIDMFLSNIAVRPDKEPDKVDDLTKIKAHGFDAKRSFRKDKKK